MARQILTPHLPHALHAAQHSRPEWSSYALNQSLPFCADTSTAQLPATNYSYPGVYSIFPPTLDEPFGTYRRLNEVKSFKCASTCASTRSYV